MRIRIVDAFTDRPFAGNPAGVVVLDRPEFPAAEWMQRVAAEVNLSETAFVHALPPGSSLAEPLAASSAADFALRWFTPAVEVRLCGHATLAAAHILHSTGVTTGPIRFATRSGVLTTTPGGDGSHTLDFPTAPLSPIDVEPRLLAALGAEPVSVWHTGAQTDDVLLELTDEPAVRKLAPNLTELATFERRGVVVTAPAADRDAGYDFVSRFFGMAAGVPEDPVTGSAHTALAPFWSSRLDGRTELTGYQASPRGGLVRVSLRGNRTHLTGRAVTVIDGDLLA